MRPYREHYMNMIWHHHIIAYCHIFMVIRNITHTFFYNLSGSRKMHLVINNVSKNMLHVIGTNRDKENTTIIMMPISTKCMSVTH